VSGPSPNFRPPGDGALLDVANSGGVLRTRPLPLRSARGRLIVSERVAAQTQAALREFKGADGPHEGIVFWAGRRDGEDHLIATAVIPRARHGFGFVHVSANDVGAAANRARRFGLALLAQVHSHPGVDTRHSDGDDDLVLMPYEGMFSLVSAHYGEGDLTLAGGVGCHQFQDDHWVQISDLETALILVPDLIRM
jgi:hypothetical protein